MNSTSHFYGQHAITKVDFHLTMSVPYLKPSSATAHNNPIFTSKPYLTMSNNQPFLLPLWTSCAPVTLKSFAIQRIKEPIIEKIIPISTPFEMENLRTFFFFLTNRPLTPAPIVHKLNPPNFIVRCPNASFRYHCILFILKAI